LDDILDAQCPYHKDIRHTLRNCRDFKHSADPSNLYHLPHREEDSENLNNLSSRKGEEAERSCASMERSTSSSEDTGRKKTKDNRSSTVDKYWWQPPVLLPPIGGQNTRSPLLGRISGSTSIIRASTLSSSIR
jgi:hypothetical protein